MFIEEMATLLRLYTDEPDQSCVSDVEVALWLQLAYDDFRGLVCELDPTIYTTSYDTAVAGSTSLELDGVLLGAAPTQPRMDTLMDITVIQGATESRWRAGTSIEDITQGAADYVLIGTQLRFKPATSASIRIYYVPTQDVDWTAGIVSGSNVFLDNMYRFHDVVPLIAYLQYAVQDAADHPQVLNLLARRQSYLKQYLSYRGGPASSEVTDSRWMEP